MPEIISIIYESPPCEHTARRCITLVDALANWGEWNLDLPPCDVTGNALIDKRLADDFRCLIGSDIDARWEWIEARLSPKQINIVPLSERADYSNALLKWWFDLWNVKHANKHKPRPSAVQLVWPFPPVKA